MKKRLLIIPALILLIIMPCCQAAKTETEAPRSIISGFSCDITANYNSMSISARMTWPSAGVCCIEIKEPIPLSGMTLNWSGGEFSLSYMGIEMPFSEEILPDSGFAEGIVNSLEAAVQETEFEIIKSGNEYIYSASGKSGDYSLSFDENSGILTGISVPSINLEADISNFETMQ